MRIGRWIATAVLAVSAGLSMADFDGPAPIAWRWTQSSQTSPQGGLASDGDLAFVANGQYCYGLKLMTGNQVWRYPAAAPTESTFSRTPVVAGDVVILQASDKYVYGVEAKTGKEVWRFRSISTLIGQGVLAGKFYVVRNSDGVLVALNAATGDPAWSAAYQPPQGVSGQLAAFGNNVIFFDSTGQLVSLSIITKSINWTLRFGIVDATMSPVVDGDTVFVSSGQYVSAVSAATGQGLWQVNLGETLVESPAVSTDGVAAISQDGSIFFLTRNGRQLGRNKGLLDSPPAVSPSSAGTSFLVPTVNGEVNLIDPKTGKLTWSFLVPPLQRDAKDAQGNPIYGIRASGPALVVGKRLLVRTMDGSLLAFDKEFGVDLTPPKVEMLWPNPGDEVSGLPPMVLYFRAQDAASGINQDKLTVTLDGKPIDFKYTLDGFIAVRFDESGPNKLMENGRHHFVVNVPDWMGNVANEDFALTINNTLPPLGSPPSPVTPGKGPGRSGPGGPGGFPGGYPGGYPGGGGGGRGGGGGA